MKAEIIYDEIEKNGRFEIIVLENDVEYSFRGYSMKKYSKEKVAIRDGDDEDTGYIAEIEIDFQPESSPGTVMECLFNKIKSFYDVEEYVLQS